MSENSTSFFPNGVHLEVLSDSPLLVEVDSATNKLQVFPSSVQVVAVSVPVVIGSVREESGAFR